MAATLLACPAFAPPTTAVPRVELSNGVQMPMMLLGVGTDTWRNDTATALNVADGLLAGFPGIDTASHYQNQRGVAAGIAAARSQGKTGAIWLTTKIPGCGHSSVIPVRKGNCYNDTLEVVARNAQELDATPDLTLLHAPPCLDNVPWVDSCGGPQDGVYPHLCDCSQPEPCAMIGEQWRALEAAYKAGATRAIGVSNYCRPCLECAAKVATVAPHVDQLHFHLGMPGVDPFGLVSYNRQRGTVVQAYQALAKGGLLHDPAVQAVAAAHNVSTAQVCLRWVLQLGHPLATSATKTAYMTEDLESWGWELTQQQMDSLATLAGHGDDIASTMCVHGAA